MFDWQTVLALAIVAAAVIGQLRHVHRVSGARQTKSHVAHFNRGSPQAVNEQDPRASAFKLITAISVTHFTLTSYVNSPCIRAHFRCPDLCWFSPHGSPAGLVGRFSFCANSRAPFCGEAGQSRCRDLSPPVYVHRLRKHYGVWAAAAESEAVLPIDLFDVTQKSGLVGEICRPEMRHDFMRSQLPTPNAARNLAKSPKTCE